jgi:hypothetical protein
VRLIVTVLASLGMGVVATGCGGSKSPSVANLGTTTAPTAGTGTTASTTQNAGTFASCMTSHGFAVTVGSGASASARGLHVGGLTFTGNVDPNSPQFQQAMDACRKYMPGGGPPSMTPSQQAEWEAAMNKFATCVRKNGIPNFQTPQLPGKGPASNANIDPGSPLVQTAFKACQALEPEVGPRIAF